MCISVCWMDDMDVARVDTTPFVFCTAALFDKCMFCTDWMVDLLDHFIKILRYSNLQTWWQVRQGEILQFQCDYVLELDRDMFDTIGIQEPHFFSSNHFTFQSKLLQQPT